MILYQLRCRKSHDFEAWFLNSDTYERQAASGDVTCPYCGTTHVEKAPMAPRIVSSSPGESTAVAPAEGAAEVRAKEVAAKILAAVEGVREHVEANAEYVGDEFADEARRIKSGEAEERDIYGEASKAEADKLDEEGISVFRLPFLRRQRKN
jgi:hypothetical protein